MKRFQYFEKNEKQLKRQFRNGDISYKIFSDYELFSQYKKNKKEYSKCVSEITAMQKNVSIKTVERAVKRMNEIYR